jgi:uncharacterized protein YndB with AHSA1/START domain
VNQLIKTVRVRCSLDRAFEVFTTSLDLWWPASHKKSGATMVLEPKLGGRFFQRLPGGEELELGSVLVWEPPHRFGYSWLPGAIDRPTEVDVRFTVEGDHVRVVVIHSEGDSGLGDAWSKRAEKFDRSWNEVLPAFAAALGGES